MQRESTNLPISCKQSTQTRSPFLTTTTTTTIKQTQQNQSQVVSWATNRGKEPFEGALLFDESHRAKALHVGAGEQSQAALVRAYVYM